MSSQEVGEPIVNVEKVVTVMPDGRKVTKTIKKITHSYQVPVPPGTPVPEGAHLISTAAVDAPMGGNGVTYQESSSSIPKDFPSQPLQQFNDLNIAVDAEPNVVVETTIDEYGRKVTKTTTTVNEGGRIVTKTATTISSSSSGPDLNTTGNFPQGKIFANAEPTVVVQTNVDENGNKVTKTTTTGSSSSSGPYLDTAGNFPQEESFANAEPNVVVETTIDEYGRKVTKTTTTVNEGGRIVIKTATTISSSSSGPDLNTAGDFPQGESFAKVEPAVVVQTTVDENGNKVTKTTTTGSSSSSSSSNPISKFFKRFSKNGSSKESKAKPLPSIPVIQAESQTKLSRTKTEPLPPHPLSLEAKRADGSKFALSDFTGHRRALLIGINYTGHSNVLNGCVNDTAVMKRFLLQVGFKEEHIRILTDDQVGTKWMPTRDNIIQNLSWLIHDAKKNDSYFLHFSGHGGKIEDRDQDETDGKDNCIFPLDYKEKGVIIDDELHNLLVKELPEGARLTALFDCCHSGSALDLPYMYTPSGYIRGSSALANLGHELVEGKFDAEALKELQLKWEKLQKEEKEFDRQVELKAANSDVIMFSGCKDDQTSADVSITRGGNTSSNGAMTYAFTKSFSANSNQSYQEMLVSIRELMEEKKYQQKPQLSSSRPMNMNELFRM
ncbi:Ca(2+)-dependent cysteine protease [Mortierella sp. AM989]|nr:Ca(2+)-dependent cysteine protease [Mortierella sp. AM989]